MKKSAKATCKACKLCEHPFMKKIFNFSTYFTINNY